MKDILVHLNNQADSRLWTATKLASLFSSRITALHVKRPLPYEYAEPNKNPDLANSFLEGEEDGAKHSRDCLDSYFGEDNPTVNYVVSTGDSGRQLIDHSCTSDLVIVEKPRPGSHYEQRVAIPVNLILGSGRPVLMVPDKSMKETLTDSVLVAWNGTRESTRALHDAMPILAVAGSVNIVSYNTHKSTEAAKRSVALEAHLIRYGVTFDLLNSSVDDSKVGSGLLSFAEKFDSDMIVMGAYGHSRISEYVLGGVSRTMIRNAPIPLLLSH